jgi:hypothetical protein
MGGVGLGELDWGELDWGRGRVLDQRGGIKCQLRMTLW